MARPRKPPPPPPEPKRRPAGTGTVGVRADGRIFCILPQDLDPKRRPIYGPGRRQRFTSREQATAWLDAEIVRRRNPTARAATLVEPLGTYLARWWRLYSPGWPIRTAKAHWTRTHHFASIGDVPLGELTPEVVQGAIAELQTATWQRMRKDGRPIGVPKRYAASTITHCRATLHQALERLVPHVLPYNPVRARRLGRGGESEALVWSADQAERFLAVAERSAPELSLGFRLILRRALRRGELLDLKWSDVDERRSLLTIDETAGDRLSESGPPKTGRVRDVPLSADLVRRLRKHRRTYPATSPHIFTERGHRVSFASFWQAWDRVVRAAGLPKITPKDARATCATILLDEGKPLPLVASLLGHSNVATTARFYARVIKRRADQTAQLGEDIDAALDQAAERARDEAPRQLRDSSGDGFSG